MKNSRLLRLISPKINSLFQRISTQLYPRCTRDKKYLKDGLQPCPMGENIDLCVVLSYLPPCKLIYLLGLSGLKSHLPTVEADPS
jgi:hypothetical protein